MSKVHTVRELMKVLENAVNENPRTLDLEVMLEGCDCVNPWQGTFYATLSTFELESD